MRKQSNIFDYIVDALSRLAITIGLVTILILSFSSVEFTVTKKKNSFLTDVGELADSAYSIARRVTK